MNLSSAAPLVVAALFFYPPLTLPAHPSYDGLWAAKKRRPQGKGVFWIGKRYRLF